MPTRRFENAARNLYRRFHTALRALLLSPTADVFHAPVQRIAGP